MKDAAVFILLGQSNAVGHGVPMEEKDKIVTVFDVRNAPHFVPDVPGNNLFKKDFVHYTPESNLWVASEIMRSYIK